MLHDYRVEAFRIREWDELSGCDRLRGVGFRYRCRCGKIGPVRHDRWQAVKEGREHVSTTER